jgi:hypothetical protein
VIETTTGSYGVEAKYGFDFQNVIGAGDEYVCS